MFSVVHLCILAILLRVKYYCVVVLICLVTNDMGHVFMYLSVCTSGKYLFKTFACFQLCSLRFNYFIVSVFSIFWI